MDARWLESQMDAAVGTMRAASAELLRSFAKYDRDRSWRAASATSMSSWLLGRYQVTRSEAKEWVRVAWALEDLPSIARAHAARRLSWSQVWFVTRFATPDDDAEWAERARFLSAADLFVEAERRRHVTSRQAEDVHNRRAVVTWWDEETSELNLRGRFGPDQGTVVERALAQRAEQLPKDERAEMPGDARMADALANALASPGDGAAAPPVTLVVHADASTLSGEREQQQPVLAETATGRRLAPAAVRRLACESNVDLVLESDGRPVGIGRAGRVVPPWLKRLLAHRDRGRCRFPGCESERWVDAHHIHHWADGGPTDLDNLVLLCDAHHRLIHEGGWRISGHSAWLLRFHDPRGRVLAPPDLQPELLAAGFP
jgi:hypothetical protein